MSGQETAERDLILVPLEREKAEALWEMAGRGEAVHVDDPSAGAAAEANKALRKALDADPEHEVAVIRDGISALEAFFSHDKDLILIDESDGVGILAGQDYADLYELLALLRNELSEQEKTSATVRRSGVRASISLDADPDPEFAESHLRASIFVDPPPRGYDREVYSFPIALKDIR